MEDLCPEDGLKEAARFTIGEEFANALSHGAGALLSLAALAWLLVASARTGSVWHVVSFGIFGASLLLLYLSSTLNHGLPPGRGKEFFHNFDQVAIYVLIAGTYTPFALTALHGPVGWGLFTAEWALALVGIGRKFFRPNRFESGVDRSTILSFVAMGWLVLFTLKPLVERASLGALLWLFAGGAFYTGGILFFKMERLRYHHLIWHLFVMAGSACHFIAVYRYLLPVKV